MLTNLIENAIKYTSGVGERVYIELACEQRSRAIVHVRDDGPGIAEEHLPYLFERFYRVDRARSPRQRGTLSNSEAPGGSGLGLSIVQWIAQAHSGEVRVASHPCTGSLFTLSLPLAAAQCTQEQ
ncbi:MAG TPA: ATP-binding protein [Ktedonobacteraceae bacterium]|jgi:signal transduction histidine kinase